MDAKGVLSLPDSTLLKLNVEDASNSSEAFNLGGCLQEAQHLYTELQNIYKR